MTAGADVVVGAGIKGLLIAFRPATEVLAELVWLDVGVEDVPA